MEASTLGRAGRKGETFPCRSGRRLPSLCLGVEHKCPRCKQRGRGRKSWWRPRWGWQWGHLIVMRLVTFTGWLCSPGGSRALNPSLGAFNHIVENSSEIQTPRPTPLIKDSEGLGSRLVSLQVIDALWNYLWTLNDQT